MRRLAPIALLGAASLVGAAVSSARPADGQLIEHQVQAQGSGMRMESWTDLATGRRRSVSTRAGQPMFESVVSAVDGKIQIDTVIYPAKTWITRTPGFPADKGQTTTEYAQHYRDMVTRGMYHIVGHDRVNGHDTLDLRHSVSMPMGTMTTDLWVDAFTYLPVRQRSSMSGMPSTGYLAYDWLPRTAENLVNLALVVPDGFKHQTQTPASSCTSGSGWLTIPIHPDNSPVFCSGQILLSHS